MLHPFKVIESELRQRLSSVKITRQREVTIRATWLIRPEVIDHFTTVHEVLGIPIVWMICSFERESGSNFTRSPAQGDRWDRISTHVPRGVGPFPSFEAAALWSYKHDGLDKNSAPWDLAYACYAWEKFNGFGPRDHGRVSGYVFSGTNQYDPPDGKAGKYVSDGVWGPNIVDQQLGCLPLALEMIRLLPELAFGNVITHTSDVEPIHVTPVPDGFSDALWIQQSLNKLKVKGTPLKEDGNFGRRTRNAIRAFQTAYPPLATDGIFGKLTKSTMMESLRDSS